MSLVVTAAVGVVFVSCGAPPRETTAAADAGAAPRSQAPAGERGGQDEFGPYAVAQNWPQPLPD